MSQVNVRDVIDGNSVKALQYWIFATCLLVAAMDGFDQAIVGVSGPALISHGLVDARSFAFVVSAGAISFVPGAFLFGMAADRWGRKPALMLGIALFAAGSVLTALSSDVTELTVSRFITGVGLGGASPCFVSLAAEYAPRRLRMTIVTLMWAGVPSGGVLGGLAASQFLASGGWQALFYIGAAAPVPILVFLALAVPESVSYLALRGGNDDRIRSILRRIAGGDRALDTATFVVPPVDMVKSSIKSLFLDGRFHVTLPLWIAFFCAFAQTIMISQYTSVLLRMSGMPPTQVATIFSFFYVGSVAGTAAAGPIISRMVHTRATAGLLFSAAIGATLFGTMTDSFPLAVLGITIAGFTVAAAIGALIALTTELYPLALRSTGLGWGLGISRVGAATAPFISALLISTRLTHVAYYAAAACLTVLGALAVLYIQHVAGPRVAPLANGPLVDAPR